MAEVFQLLMALVLLAGVTLVATVTTLALRGITGRVLPALAISAAMMALLFLLLSGGDLALPLLALAAHGLAALLLWLRARRASR
jgi:hypothetical protein